MRPEASEDQRSADEDDPGDQPEVEGEHIVALPEPDMVDEALAVAFDDVVDRIQFDHVEVLLRQYFRRPEDRGHPEEELYDHADDLTHVAEEEDDRGGQPGKAEEEGYGGEEVVEHLDAVNGDWFLVDDEHDEDDGYEKGVKHHGGEYFHNRQHPDAEVYFFQEK